MGSCVLCMAFRDAAGREGYKPALQGGGREAWDRVALSVCATPVQARRQARQRGSFLARRTYVVM